LAKLYIQQLIIDGKLDFVWSFILEYENSNNPYNVRKNAIRKFSYRCTRFIEATDEIMVNAGRIASTGIRGKDSLHLACALFSQCDYFITTDDRLLKFKSNEIKMTDSVQFIKEMDGL
jgi:predicted nucleic acid-binding protein